MQTVHVYCRRLRKYFCLDPPSLILGPWPSKFPLSKLSPPGQWNVDYPIAFRSSFSRVSLRWFCHEFCGGDRSPITPILISRQSLCSRDLGCWFLVELPFLKLQCELQQWKSCHGVFDQSRNDQNSIAQFFLTHVYSSSSPRRALLLGRVHLGYDVIQKYAKRIVSIRKGPVCFHASTFFSLRTVGTGVRTHYTVLVDQARWHPRWRLAS